MERWRRLPLWGRAFAVLGGALGAWLLLVNVTLNARIIPALINAHPEKVRIGWTSAWSVWPFVVHVRGFQLRVQDDNVQLALAIDAASVRVNPWQLWHREYDARWVRARGVSYLMRFRPRSDEERDLHAPVVPPIEGLEFAGTHEEATPASHATAVPTAAKQPAPAKTPPSPFAPKNPEDAEKREHAHEEEEDVQALLDARPDTGRLWRVRLENVEVEDVTEVWIEDWRWQGHGRASGGFFLRPKRTLEIAPSKIELTEGTVRSGERVLADPFSLTVAGSVEKMNPDRHKGVDFFDFLAARVDLAGDVSELSFLNGYLREAPWLRVHGGGGPLRATVELQRGKFLGGTLEGHGKEFELDVFDDHVRGAARVEWAVEPKAAPTDPLVSRLDVLFDRFDVRRGGQTTPYVHGEKLTLSAKSRDLSLFDPGANVAIAVDLPRAQITDLSGWNSYFPPEANVSVEGGTGTVEAHLAWDAATDRGKGRLAVAAKGVKGHVEDLDLEGDVAVATEIREARLREKRLEIAGTTFAADNVTLSGPSAPRRHPDGWWAHVQIPRGTIRPGEEQFFDATVDAQLRDSAPLVAAFLMRKKLPRLAEIGLEEALDVHDVHASGQLGAGKKRLSLDDLAVDGNALEIRGRMRVDPSSKTALAFVRRGPFAVAVSVDPALHLDLVNPRAWYEKRLLDATATSGSH
ncbi:MAG TPA: hypothetical protein VMV18_03945 [bacterium]|nr:hypothetical protein [bacterium]